MVGKAGNPVNPATPENAEIEEIYHFHSGANLKQCIFWNKGNPVENTFFVLLIFCSQIHQTDTMLVSVLSGHFDLNQN